MDKGDECICQYLKVRDRRGMECLFDAYYKPLVLWSLTFLEDLSEAEDTVQEFFLAVWERRLLADITPEGLRKYLFRGVKNNSLKRLQRRPPVSRTYDLAQWDAAWEEYDFFSEERMQRIQRAVEQLPDRTRQVIEQVYLEGKSYKEAAGYLGISPVSVNTFIVRALKKLRHELGETEETVLLSLVAVKMLN